MEKKQYLIIGFSLLPVVSIICRISTYNWFWPTLAEDLYGFFVSSIVFYMGLKWPKLREIRDNLKSKNYPQKSKSS